MLEITNMILFSLVLLFTFITNGYTIAPDCCNTILSNKSCRHACEKLSSSENGFENELVQIQHILDTTNHCPADQIEYWKCINSSLSVTSSVTAWSGRPCCDLAISRHCSEACRQAQSVEELETVCRRSTETNLYGCMDKQKVGQKCCASVEEYTCRLVCQGTFLIQTLTRQEQRQILKRQCGSAARPIMQCASDHIRSTRNRNPEDSLHCCEKATDSACRNTCIHELKTGKDNDEVVVDKLIKNCGDPLPTIPMWACFLDQPQHKKPDPDLRKIGDGACLQCCAKAVNDRCHTLCVQTCSDYNNYWKEFREKCQDFSNQVSRMEVPMLTCVAEVEEPCKFGCDGLDYCTNFNNRPVELFRSCNKRADEAAKLDVQSWKKGYIELPHLKIPVKDIEECDPEMWKAIACALQIKPCHKKPTPLSLCREDCKKILEECVDRTRLAASQTVDVLCNALSPIDNVGSCVSVKKFLTPSPYELHKHEVTNPCKDNPCEERICWINRRKCRHNCQPYVCHSACPMGDVTNVMVPRNAYVRIPEFQEDKKNEVCQAYRVCSCGKHNNLENCKLIPCLKKKSCEFSVPGQGRVIKEHGSHFRLDCKDCVCHSGESICTKHKCPPDKLSIWSGLPCDCSRHYSPRCGQNGKTYPNQCIATRCGGQKDVSYGTCTSIDPCANKPCESGYSCMVRRQVCLSTTHPCLQYQCVKLTTTDKCNHHHHDPVCDTNGEEYTNPCLLLAHNRKLAYRGHCIKHCSMSSSVCGHNGETYPSECAALADRTTVDYLGPCRIIGHFSGNITTSGCDNVQCSNVIPKHCRPITPPGGCCPICAAELRALYSQPLTDVAAEAMNSEPLTVHSILDILSHHLTVAECDVFGYLSVEGDLVILVTTVTASPVVLQVQACIKEAERIEYLIQTDSPTLMSYVALTPLLLAPIRTPIMAPLAAAGTSLPSISLMTILIFFSILRTHVWM